MKRIAAIIAMLLALSQCAFAWYVGAGTEDDPYIIADASDFSYFRYRVNSGLDDEGCYYRLSNDIQITSQTRTAPVGLSGAPFTGHFDGGGHIIHVKILPLEEDNEALLSFDRSLFGYVDAGDGYAVRNLHVAGYAGGYLAAGVASRLISGRIEACTFSGDIEAMTITGNEDTELHMIHAGGIVADMYGGEIVSCDFGGNVTTKGGSFFSYAGGIAGAMSAGSITGCNVRHYSVITAEGSTENAALAGGIVGFLEVEALESLSDDATITGCTFEGGEITSVYTAGGIAGHAYGGIISDNTVGDDTRITGGVCAGGVAGILAAGGYVSGNNVEGGYVQAGSRAAGGIAGLLEVGEIRDNYSRAAVRGDAPYKGGIVGEIHNHYGTTDNVTGNTFMGSGYAIGIDEHMSRNVDGGNTRLDPVLYFEGSTTLTQALENVPYSETITLSLPAVVDLTEIPSWMSPVQSGNTITLSGIPTDARESSFTIAASYGYQTVSRTFRVNIRPQLSVSADSYISARVGDYVDIPLYVYADSYDISGATFTWSLYDGTLPADLSVDASGSISGYLASSGTYDITVQVTPENVSLSPVTKSITINAVPNFTITTDSILPYALLGGNYSQYISHDVSSGDSVEWSMSGYLPEGLSFDAGTIAGIVDVSPDAAGDYAFNVVLSVAGFSESKDFSLKVVGLFFSPDVLPSVVVGNEYSHDLRSYLEVYGVSEDLVFFTMDEGDIPSGLSLDEDGMISGTPSVSGTYTFPVNAVLYGFTAESECVLTIYPALSIIVPDAWQARVKVGDEIPSCVFTVSPDVAPVTWSFGGSYPDGLTLGSLTGQLSGQPTTAGVYTFTVQATYGATTAESELTLTVDPSLTITTDSLLPYAFTGGEYTLTLSHDAPSGNAVTWEKLSGGLPEGFTLGSDGTLTGSTDREGRYEFTLRASAGTYTASKDFTLPVIRFIISSDSELKAGVVGEKYSFDLKATGFAESFVTWSADSEALPSGLTLTSSGRISGTPITEGSYTFQVFALSGDIALSKDLTITIYPALEITDPENFPARVKAGQSFSYTFSTESDNPENIYWAVSSGTLPDGLLLGNLTGEISGIPTASGTFTFTVQASNGAASSAYPLTLIIDPVLTITTASPLQYAFTGSQYSIVLEHDAPEGNNVSWEKVSGTLPSGFTLSPDGTISGITSTAGEYTFTVRASAGLYTASKDFTLPVMDVQLSFDASLPDAESGTYYSHQFTALGISQSLVTWSADVSSLPDGMTFSTAGLLSGTPSGTGSYSFLVSASSGDITVSRYASLKVVSAFTVSILTGTLPDAVTGIQYSQALSCDKPSGYTASWAVISGDLPSGIALSDGGTVSGVAGMAGSYTFTVRLTAGGTASRDFTLTVRSADTSPDTPVTPGTDKPSVSILTQSLPDGTTGQFYSVVLIANPDGSSWTHSGGIIPPGLTMSGDGVIAGVPSRAGDFYFTVTASHESYLPASTEYSLHISDVGGGTSHSSSGGGGCDVVDVGLLAAMIPGLMPGRRKKRR